MLIPSLRVGFTDLCLDPNEESNLSTNLSQVQESSSTLLSTIADVLDLSKIESGQLQICKAPYSLPSVLEKVGKNATGLLSRKGDVKNRIELRCSADSAISQFVIGDEGRILQVLLNLTRYE